MWYKKILLLLLCIFFNSCKLNGHYFGLSDTHFTYGQKPKITIKLKNCSSIYKNFDDLSISSSDGSSVSMKQKLSHDIEIVVEIDDEDKFVETDDDKDKSDTKRKTIEINIKNDEDTKYHIKLDYERYYQLISPEAGLGKRFLFKTIDTNIHYRDIKNKIANKFLQRKYVNENEIEIYC